MSDLTYLFEQCKPYTLNPPYAGETIQTIRGIVVPEDYIKFIRLHNGGIFSNKNCEECIRFVLFSLEDIIKGECYKDDNGYWLGSAHSAIWEEQDCSTNTLTNPHGIPTEDVAGLYHAFYDDHIVIGYYESDSGTDGDPYINLIAIDRDGKYRVLCDGDAEELGHHDFGEKETGEYGNYWKIFPCYYESPMGLLECCTSPEDYHIVDRSELELKKAHCDYYQGYAINKKPEWSYNIWKSSDCGTKAWGSSSMKELFQYFLSGEI